MQTIKNDKDHKKGLKDILLLMNKGQANLTKAEKDKVKKIGIAIQSYESSIYTISTPKTLEGIIELRMYEMHLNQQELAKKLGVSTAKLSLILNGKQKPDVDFLKSVYTKLNVSADFILNAI